MKEEVKMEKRKKYVSVILILMLILLLTGCERIYTKKDMIRYAEKTLEDKYGEEFQVRGELFNVSGSCFEANVSPVNNPEIIFEVSYNAKGSEYNRDYYIRALIASQYKELAEKELETIPCDYYLQVKVRFSEGETPITDTGVTIEEFNNITEETSQEIEYFIYFSKDILKESDEYIYEKIQSIMEIREGRLDIFFLMEEDLELVKTEFSERYELDGSTMTYIHEKYVSEAKGGKKGYIHFIGENIQKEQLNYEEFIEKMEEIREDAKQW